VTSGALDGGSTSDADDGALDDGGFSCIEGGAGPKGTMLVRSTSAIISGLTGDDQVVYVDTASSTLWAVPASGGKPTSIAPAPTNGIVAISGNLVFDWTGIDSSGFVASALQVWAAGRSTTTVATASLVGSMDISADGSKIAYCDGATASAADVYVAGPDGSGKVKVASGLPWWPGCLPQPSFVGTAVLVGYCTAAPPATGTPVGTLVVYPGAAGMGITLSTNAVLAPQGAGTNILFQTSGGGLTLADATTGATTVVDARGTSALFSDDGQTFFYATSDGALKRGTVAAPMAATTLVGAAGFSGVQALSHDGNWLLASKMNDPSSGDTDIYVASATAAGAATSILSSATGAFYGNPFTADSSHVLYADDTMYGAGELHAVPATGDAAVSVASQVWIWLATGGAKLVYQGDFVPMAGLMGQGIADISWVDVSAANLMPTRLVQQADPGIALTSAGDRIVYAATYCAAPGSQGIWVMPTP
jgi:hypothetical protein